MRVQIVPEFEAMLAESMHMLVQLTGEAAACAAQMQQVAPMGVKLDAFASKIALATSHAVRLEGQSAVAAAQASRLRTDGAFAAAEAQQTSSTSTAQEAELAREAAQSAMHQSSTLREQCKQKAGMIAAAQQQFQNTLSTHEQMMHALHAATMAATLRTQADLAAQQTLVSAARVSEAQRQATVARAAAAEMRARAEHLHSQGQASNAALAEKQYTALQNDAKRASEAAAIYEAELAEFSAQLHNTQADVEEADGLAERPFEAHAQGQQLALAQQRLHNKQATAARAQEQVAAATAVAKEQSELARESFARASSLQENADNLKSAAQLDAASDAEDIAGSWRARAEDAQRAAHRAAEDMKQHEDAANAACAAVQEAHTVVVGVQVRGSDTTALLDAY